MLQSLYIQNYALINKLDIHLNKGLSIITGETGAGKSIIVGALSLISGQRADMSLVRDNTKKCIVEATFDIKAYRLQHFFEQYGIDYEDNTIIRREINPSGKSRAFINDSPFDLNTLKELGDKLVDIHSQHQNLNLKNNLFQLKVVDTLANHHDLLEHYKEIYKELQHFKKQYNSLKEDFEKNKADLDYYQYQFDQIDKAALKNGEQEDLENELNKLDHAEEIKTNLSKSSYLLNGEGETVLDLLKEINEALFSIKDFFPKVNDCSDRLNSSYIELKDLASEISMLNEEIEFDPQRLEEIRERLDLIYSLQQKHRVDDIAGLLNIKDDLEKKIDTISTSDEQLETLKNKIEQATQQAETSASQLHQNRKNIIPDIEESVIHTLKQLGIPNASFKIELSSLNDFTIHGKDDVKFLFSANKNEPEKDIVKIASGGEISRFMLSLKYLISSKLTLPTIVFDEIDAGVSGEIANKMGNILKDMSTNMQVINITHLPQVAAQGDKHYYVYKKDDAQFTNTYIKLLDNNERLHEIAKMLSGKEMTDEALNNAKVLLQK